MDSLGPYRLDSELGRGAMGVVFRGFDPAIGRPVAIKIVRVDQFATVNEKAEMRLRFAREATAAGKLSHPNIVTVFQLGEQGDLQYLVMELVDGWSLEKALSNGIPQDRGVYLSILSQVAGALDYAHSKGIVHRDVKPANIMVRRDGKIKITDFGIARIASQTVTKTGFGMGTPFYMAPEQMQTARVNGRADQFSLAVMAYQMLGGRMPFIADNLPGLTYKILNEEAQPLHELDRSFSPRTSDVLKKGMAKDPEQRFATCVAFIRGLSDSTLGPKVGDFKVNPRDGLKYMWIPPGTFMMGCSPGDNQCYADEEPAHEVTISRAFWLGQTDVTQAAFQRVMNSNPSAFKGDNLPVEQVTWDEAQGYCQKIGGRLPTEAEWEYAARAGSPAARYGNLDDIAWYSGNSGGKTHEVGQKQANAFGLFDMLGNVWQWTADWYDAGHTMRALRGGSWLYNPRGVRVSYRSRLGPGYRFSDIGFRCVGE